MNPPRAKEIIDALFEHERGPTLEEMAEYVGYMGQRRHVRVEIESNLLQESYKTFFGHPVRKDKPHFDGDEYHAHVELDGGYEVAWAISGRRRHPNKFPAHVPDSARAAVAKRLGVSQNLLDSFWVDEGGERTLLFEVRTQP